LRIYDVVEDVLYGELSFASFTR